MRSADQIWQFPLLEDEASSGVGHARGAKYVDIAELREVLAQVRLYRQRCPHLWQSRQVRHDIVQIRQPCAGADRFETGAAGDTGAPSTGLAVMPADMAAE